MLCCSTKQCIFICLYAETFWEARRQTHCKRHLCEVGSADLGRGEGLERDFSVFLLKYFLSFELRTFLLISGSN